MLDKDKQPMMGVLLSLSGERQYRSNNVTGETGTLVFTSLVSIVLTPSALHGSPVVVYVAFLICS